MMCQREPRVTWGDDGWAASNGWSKAHCTNKQSGEYTGLADVWVSAGTGLPDGAYLDSPPTKEADKAIVRTAEGWAQLSDHRGATAYIKLTGAPFTITELGELPVLLTWHEPLSRFDSWDEQAGIWVKNDAAEHQYLTTQAEHQKDDLLALATAKIAPLQDAVDIGMATQAEEAALLDWKRYRVMLTRVDVTQHPVIWPLQP